MTSYLQTAGWALIHFVWQGAAIAAAASVLLRLTRHRSASTRYVIACVGLAAMLAAPLVTARLMWTTPSSPIGGASATVTGPDVAQAFPGPLASKTGEVRQGSPTRVSEGASPAIERIIPGVTVAWMAGVLLLLARMAGGWWRVRRLHHVALSTASSRWQTACRRLAYRLGLPAAAHVVESALVDVPTVVGWLRPAILLPIAALASLTPEQIEAILAHELAHIRRHDYAVNVLQTLAETLLFYHPLVWWISKRIRVEREHCCDDIAIAICGDPVGYAQALAELESWRTSAATMVMAATGGSLLDRVRRILRMPIADEPRSLLELAPFDSTTVQPLLQRVGQAMKSDYDRRQVLEHVASRVTLDQKGVAAYVQAMATMKSDYDQREALSALTRRSGAAADGETLLPALAHIKSSYDKRVALEQVLARGTMGTEGKRIILTAAAGIQSDYDRRLVLTAYLKRFGVEPALRDEFFAAVRAIGSDYDTAEVLLAAVGPGIDPNTRPAFVLAAERITSSHDQNRVLAALVKSERR